MTTREVVDQYLKMIESGDIVGAVALFAEPVDWNFSGAKELPWTGSRSTHAEIAAYFPTFFANVRAEQYSTELFMTEGENAVLMGSARDRSVSTGVVFDTPFVVRITVREGKIVRYHFLDDSYTVATSCGVAAPTGSSL